MVTTIKLLLVTTEMIPGDNNLDEMCVGGRLQPIFTSNASEKLVTLMCDVEKDIQTNTDLGLDFINDLRTYLQWKALL